VRRRRLLNARCSLWCRQLTDEPLEIPEPAGGNAESQVFFETLHLQPVQIEVSFMRTESSDKEQKCARCGRSPTISLTSHRTFLDNRNPVAFALNALTMALGNVNEAPLQLNALFIENVRLSWPVLIERISLHYRQEAVGQLYRVLGSADFIGNPVGLFKNVTSGVTDLWYEPFNGVALYGDRDIPFGVARVRAAPTTRRQEC
jgi:vacuolar protein sorting-associated protein 13A/C